MGGAKGARSAAAFNQRKQGIAQRLRAGMTPTRNVVVLVGVSASLGDHRRRLADHLPAEVILTRHSLLMVSASRLASVTERLMRHSFAPVVS
jgi:hypothetical protein